MAHPFHSSGTSNFYPRPPRGGRRHSGGACVLPHPISIHALREEGDLQHDLFGNVQHISIHALREEGDGAIAHCQHFAQISIHALREEGDRPH